MDPPDLQSHKPLIQSAGMAPAGVVATPPMVVVMPTPTMGFQPATITCPFCQQHVTTTVDYEAGGLSWIIMAVLCFFGYVFFLHLFNL
jgi:hypothetical protein